MVMSMPPVLREQAVIAAMWTSFLMFSFILHIISGHLSTMGTEFAVAIPKMMLTDNVDNSSIHFMLTTLSDKNVEVKVSTPHYPGNESIGNGLDETIIIQGKSGVTYDMDDRFKHREDVGRKWSYKFLGNGTFSLTVLAVESDFSVLTYQAIPVSAWGTKYVAVTLVSNPSIQIVSGSDDNLVLFKFVVIGKRYSESTHGGIEMMHGAKFNFTLQSDEAYSVSQCIEGAKDFDKKLHLTGSTIEAAKRVGVISGNCRSTAVQPYCKPQFIATLQWANQHTDNVAEMILSEESWGREFITMVVPVRQHQGAVQMVPSEAGTDVTIILSSSDRMVLTLDFNRDKFNFVSVQTFPLSLRSSKPILVVHIQPPICYSAVSPDLSEPLGDASLSLIVPTPLFHWAYIWMVPPLPFSHQHFVALIAIKSHISSISLDGKPIPKNTRWEHARGGHDYHATMINMTSGANRTSHVNTTLLVHTVVSKSYLRFGCYIYGHGTQSGYMHPAGFQACDTVTDKPKMTAADGIDNDCDGQIDEEYQNRIDDDKDGLIDEDTRKFRQRCPQQYTWGSNCEKKCSNCAEDCLEDSGQCFNCKDGFKHSLGGCDTACESLEYGRDCQGSCLDKCGRDCINRSTGECEACPLNFTWGVLCELSCIHCIDDCDDVTGRCSRCHGGYKNAPGGCDTECEENEYGEDCSGSCFHKCGGDCVDRRSGKCEQKFRALFVILPCLLLVPLVFLCMMASKRQNRQFTLAEDALNVQRMSTRRIISHAKV